jgi:hypothetical protein
MQAKMLKGKTAKLLVEKENKILFEQDINIVSESFLEISSIKSVIIGFGIILTIVFLIASLATKPKKLIL